MKIKDGCEATSTDFWYDLTYGGYLKPENILENAEDAERVREAIDVLLEFELSCEEYIPGFAQ